MASRHIGIIPGITVGSGRRAAGTRHSLPSSSLCDDPRTIGHSQHDDRQQLDVHLLGSARLPEPIMRAWSNKSVANTLTLHKGLDQSELQAHPPARQTAGTSPGLVSATWPRSSPRRQQARVGFHVLPEPDILTFQQLRWHRTATEVIPCLPSSTRVRYSN